MAKNKTRFLTLSLAVAGLLLAGCSGDETSTEDKPASTAAANTTAPEAETTTPLEADDYETTLGEGEGETPTEGMAPEAMLAASIDANPLTGGEVTASEADCMVNYVAEADPELFNTLVAAEMNGEELDDVDDMTAGQAMTVLRGATECTRDSVITAFMTQNPELEMGHAECLFDELYGEDSATMATVAMAVEMETSGISEDDPEFLVAAMGLLAMLAEEPARIATTCDVDESIVSNAMEESDDDMGYDDMDYEGMDDGDMGYDEIDEEEISADELFCLITELEGHPELLEALMNDGDDYEPENIEDLTVLLEAALECGIENL